MNTFDMSCMRVVAVPLAATLLLITSDVTAQQPGERSRLGIRGHFDYGYGMVVESVRWGGPASRIGLEPGDVIRAIDGRWLRTETAYRRALSRDARSARLIVEDVRTGRLISRPIDLRRAPRRSAIQSAP